MKTSLLYSVYNVVFPPLFTSDNNSSAFSTSYVGSGVGNIPSKSTYCCKLSNPSGVANLLSTVNTSNSFFLTKKLLSYVPSNPSGTCNWNTNCNS